LIVKVLQSLRIESNYVKITAIQLANQKEEGGGTCRGKFQLQWMIGMGKV
jgi:hypothetical protein